MRELFDYYINADRTRIKMVISEALPNIISFQNANKDMISVEELNKLDRTSIAKLWITQRSYNGKYRIDTWYTLLREYTDKELLNDITEYIDLILPRRYFGISERIRRNDINLNTSDVNKYYKGIIDVKGSIYHYNDNYSREEFITCKALKKIVDSKPYQKFSTEQLYIMVSNDAKNAGYELIKSKDNLSRDELIALLNFFYKDTELKNLFDYVQYE